MSPTWLNVALLKDTKKNIPQALLHRKLFSSFKKYAKSARPIKAGVNLAKIAISWNSISTCMDGRIVCIQEL